MTEISPCVARNAKAVPVADIPLISVGELRDAVICEVAKGSRISAFFGQPAGKAIRLYAVLARDESGTLALISTEVEGSFPSLTPDCPQAHWFEREIAEQWGIVPSGHPWLKPIRFHSPYAGQTVFPDPAPSALQSSSRFVERKFMKPPSADSRRHYRTGPLPFPVPRRKCLSSEICWDTSTAASSVRWRLDRQSAGFT